MTDIEVSLDHEEYTSKPTGNEPGQISDRIGKSIELLNCPAGYYEFIHKVALYGHTFSPATFNNESRSDKNFKQMQLFALDFDNIVEAI